MATVMTRANQDISARNQIKGRVTGIQMGDAMSVVSIEGDGHRLMAAITAQSVSELALKVGDSVVACIKSTELVLAKGTLDAKLSTRNQITGQVTSIKKGNAMAAVNIDAGPFQLTSAITRAAADDLHLNTGDRVVACIKATEVILQKG